MKRKFANGEKIDILEKEFFYKTITEESFNGNICLLKINKVQKTWYVTDLGKTYCILNNNYKWLEIYPENEKYAITAMYNEKNQLIEWYFDMIKNTGIENGIPYIDDLYLDLVIKANGDFVLLDEDELKEALEFGDITKEDFNLAYQTMKKIKNKYENNLEELYSFTEKMYNKFIF